MKDFINITDFTGEQLAALIERAIADKRDYAAGELAPSLDRRVLAMIFEKPSLRTRVSFESAMTHLGGHAICLSRDDIGLGEREDVADVARVLGRMCDGIMARTFSHELVEQLAAHSPAPVINALTDYSHPCQAMADLMTVREHFGDLAGRTLVFVGDGNNVARSLAAACERLGVTFILAGPETHHLSREFVSRLAGPVRQSEDVRSAVADADVIYTDTWVSMGQEAEKAARQQTFAPFRIDAGLLAAAPDHAIVLHCLPAYKGSEITEDVFEAHAETIFAEAANRLHFQRTLLNVLIGEGGIA